MSLAHPPNDEDTIAALGTPPGVGAIAVVRVSGPQAREISDRVFRGTQDLARAASQTVHHGYAVGDSGARLDEVLAAVFVAPKSYTGEDLVEISCHGGPLPAALVLEALLKAGARPAGPGEFTKRAFLSGRLDLSQAEAVAEIVGSRSRAGLKAALSQLDGALSSRVRRLREELVGLLAEIEARLDFSEDVEEPVQAEAIKSVISSVLNQLDELLEGASMGRLVREGARVVIAGRPNVGKSSLLNALVGRDRAIVTPVPGTTRDTIEEWVELEGVLLTLADTAGLRTPGDMVEAEGVRRTRQLIQESQLVLAVVEMPSTPSPDEIALIADLASESPVIPVANKKDLGGDAGKWRKAFGGASIPGSGECARSGADEDRAALQGGRLAKREESGPGRASDRGRGALPDRSPCPVLPCAFVSARTGDGVSELKGRIVEALCGSRGSLEAYQDEVLLTNVRHVDALLRAHQALGRARDGLDGGLTEELLAFEVGQALHAVGEVSGESVTEEVLETIFSRFCIGK